MADSCVRHRPIKKRDELSLRHKCLHKSMAWLHLCLCFTCLVLCCRLWRRLTEGRSTGDICVAFLSWRVLDSIKEESWGNNTHIPTQAHTDPYCTNSFSVTCASFPRQQAVAVRTVILERGQPGSLSHTAKGSSKQHSSRLLWLPASANRLANSEGLMLDVCGCPGPPPVLTGELHYPADR